MAETSVIPTEDANKRVLTFASRAGCMLSSLPGTSINIPVEYLAPGLAAGNAIVWGSPHHVGLCGQVDGMPGRSWCALRASSIW
jgi:succinate-semialdehyde dehydrogenase/glutarate-semialdehyde dehydrogenase